MKLKPFIRVGRRRADIDDVVRAYWTWRRECAAARAAYRRWTHAAASDARCTFAAYRLALDREEWAADTYAGLLSGVRRRPELDVARRLAELPSLFGAV